MRLRLLHGDGGIKMNRYKVEFVTSRECDAVEGGGAWCVIERKRTHDEVISQHDTEAAAKYAARFQIAAGAL